MQKEGVGLIKLNDVLRMARHTPIRMQRELERTIAVCTLSNPSSWPAATENRAKTMFLRTFILGWGLGGAEGRSHGKADRCQAKPCLIPIRVHAYQNQEPRTKNQVPQTGSRFLVLG